MQLPTLLSLLILAFPVQEEPLSHALYLAVVQIDHSDTGSDAQVLIKVFTNDLEDVIRAAYPEAYKRVLPEAFCNRNHSAIERYFRAKLKCEISEQTANLNFLEGTRENDVFWLKFQLKAPEKWENISIRAPFFMEIFSSQSNIIQVIHGSEKRFARLTKEAQVAEFDL